MTAELIRAIERGERTCEVANLEPLAASGLLAGRQHHRRVRRSLLLVSGLVLAVAVCIDLTCVMAARERQRDKQLPGPGPGGQAGEGLDEWEMDEIIQTIVNSLFIQHDQRAAQQRSSARRRRASGYSARAIDEAVADLRLTLELCQHALAQGFLLGRTEREAGVDDRGLLGVGKLQRLGVDRSPDYKNFGAGVGVILNIRARGNAVEGAPRRRFSLSAPVDLSQGRSRRNFPTGFPPDQEILRSIWNNSNDRHFGKAQ